MKKKVLFFVTVATVTISTAFIPNNSEVYAQPTLNEISTERAKIKKQLSKAEKQVAEILLEIEEINEELKLVQSSLKENQNQQKEIKTEIKKYEEDIEELQKEIDQLEEEIEKRNDILKNRISSYQENGGNIHFLDVLFGAKDFTDLISRISAVTTITKADAELIELQREDQQKMLDKQSEVEQKLEEQEELFDELKGQEEVILEQKEAVEKGKKELEKKEKELKEKKSKLESEDSDLATLEEQIRAQMVAPAPTVKSTSNNSSQTQSSNSSQTQSSNGNNTESYSGGKLAWPTSGGYISSHIGTRWGRMHKGIDIARTDRSTKPPIYAAEGGKVEVVKSGGGYGNYIIINHGNGLKTLYAHLDSVSVKQGQSVSRGQTIGIMGSTGNSTGIHLHFEVHLNGQIQNPINYLG